MFSKITFILRLFALVLAMLFAVSLMLIMVIDQHWITLIKPENVVIAVNERAISVVISVLTYHHRSETVCRSACCALRCVTVKPGTQ